MSRSPLRGHAGPAAWRHESGARCRGRRRRVPIVSGRKRRRRLVRSVPEPPQGPGDTPRGARSVQSGPTPTQRGPHRCYAARARGACFVLPVVERGLLSEKPVGGVGVCVRVCARACVFFSSIRSGAMASSEGTNVSCGVCIGGTCAQPRISGCVLLRSATRAVGARRCGVVSTAAGHIPRARGRACAAPL